MALYDQNQMTGASPATWYNGQQPMALGTALPTQQTPPLNQFVWINSPGTVDMWPVAAGSEMTFIDGENMMLYVKRVDEYNHPLKVRKFKMVEITEEPEIKAAPSVELSDLDDRIARAVERAVSEKLSGLFTSHSGGTALNV